LYVGHAMSIQIVVVCEKYMVLLENWMEKIMLYLAKKRFSL